VSIRRKISSRSHWVPYAGPNFYREGHKVGIEKNGKKPLFSVIFRYFSLFFVFYEVKNGK